jgi:Mn2+/Fe2+ NRAMP family transporter
MKYSIAELCTTLFVVAIFVNSSILIIAASSLSETAQDADLFGMYILFVSSISQAAGTMFALLYCFLESVQESWPPWQDAETRKSTVSLKNNLPTAIGGWIIWVIIGAMNIATLAFLGLGIGGD